MQQPLAQRLEQLNSFAEAADDLAGASIEPKAKEEWQFIAASWRQLAERTLADRIGAELLAK